MSSEHLELDERKRFIQQGFDTVAAGYDHPSLSFFPKTAKQLVELLSLDPDQHLLDVCTGTGCVAIEAASILHEGSVTGVDLSSGMLDQARKKAESSGLHNIDFVQMDFENLDLPSDSFDIATSSFGLFFLEDMTAGLLTIVDKVKPGGKVAISSFAGDAFLPMADVFINNYEATGREVPPLSWKRLATPELIREQFSQADIDEVEIFHHPFGYKMTSSQQWWDVVWNAGWRSFLNQMTSEEQKEFERRHRKEIDALIGDGGVWFNTEVHIAIGIR